MASKVVTFEAETDARASILPMEREDSSILHMERDDYQGKNHATVSRNPWSVW